MSAKRKLTATARKLRTATTDVERILWQRIRAYRLGGFKFKRQEPIGRYVVDFVCYEGKLVVELDGGQHAEAHTHDAERDVWLRGQGFAVLRYWNNEVIENLDGVLEDILRHLALPPSLAPSHRGRGDWAVRAIR
jgi:very-short-patch-repair endonuclease